MHLPINRASRIALGVLAAASCVAACTLMKPSHEDLSGGEEETPGADAAPDASTEANVQPEAGLDAPYAEAEVSLEDVADALDGRADGDATDEDAAADAPLDAKDASDEPPLTCDAGGKVCQNACVAIDDPDFGCGQTTCQPCALPGAVEGCHNGKCSVESCDTGLANCDSITSNGCESDLQIDSNNCGSCGHACTAPPHMITQCVAGQCTAAVCATGWADCDSDGGINGCETPVDADPDNCGACWNVCPGGPNGVRECNGGKCVMSCAPNYGDCDNDLLNGCEALLNTDPNHCGDCGTTCTFAHATAKCVLGGCRLDTCKLPWGDCNLIESDGCEKDLSTDKSNCGQCWNKCLGNQTCVLGVCSN